MLWYTGMERKIAVHSQVLIFNFFLVVDPFLWDYGFGVSIVAVAAGSHNFPDMNSGHACKRAGLICTQFGYAASLYVANL